MNRKYKPIGKNCLVTIHNDLDKMKSGLIIKDINTEIYEIVALPDELPDGYEDLKIGTLFYAWKNWRGFRVGKTEDYKDILVIDLPDIAAIVE